MCPRCVPGVSWTRRRSQRPGRLPGCSRPWLASLTFLSSASVKRVPWPRCPPCSHDLYVALTKSSREPPLYQQDSAGDLMIRNIQLQHAGKYVCVVQTSVDQLSAAAGLIVRGRGSGFVLRTVPGCLLPHSALDSPAV